MKNKRTVIRLIIFFFLSGFLYAGANNYVVEGKIYKISDAPVYIFLVDEETSKIPFSGIKKLIIKPDSQAVKTGFVRFIFNDVPEGTYGIRCFQDINNNGKLDKGIFGPSEPWGLSWNKYKTSKWPRFINFSFSVSGNIENLQIYLQGTSIN